MLALVVVEGVAIGLLGLLVAGLLRSHAEILRALHELGASIDPDADPPTGGGPTDIRIARRPAAGDATAYDVTGATLDRDDVAALAIVGSPQHTLLAFLSSGCGTCASFWEAFRQSQVAVPGDARLVIVTKDAREESEARLRQLAPPEVTLVLSSATWEDYQVPAAPYFVFVDGPAGRVVGEGSGASWPQVADLMQQAIADAEVGPGRAAGRSTLGAADADRGARTERELLAAGIGPGHPSLYTAPDAAGRED
ncbi:MAG: TlpA family protein disulfide reductase [Mycobacteriales bacterium]